MQELATQALAIEVLRYHAGPWVIPAVRLNPCQILSETSQAVVNSCPISLICYICLISQGVCYKLDGPG